MAKKTRRDQGWGKERAAKKCKNVHEQIADGRKKRGLKSAAKRVNTIKANGGLPESRAIAPEPDAERLPIGEAMRRAVEELGDVKIDDDLAPSQLRQLADCYEDVTRRQAAFNAKSEEAKTAKKSLESATDLLLEKVRAFTHPSPLPLFDQASAESDLEAMIDAGAGGPLDESESASL